MGHKMNWTVDEIKKKFAAAESSTRWTTTQVRVLLDQIAKLEQAEQKHKDEQLFLLTLLDEAKTDNVSIKRAASMVGIKLPSTTKTKTTKAKAK